MLDVAQALVAGPGIACSDPPRLSRPVEYLLGFGSLLALLGLAVLAGLLPRASTSA